jgi:glycosyltransferase involved in cell wall biosynthesis
MAMALPVVATAWGGPAAFLDARTGFPLNWTHLARAPGGAFAGHRFAEPDARALARTLAGIARDPADARARGARAREKMLTHYAPETVAAYAARLAAEALAEATRRRAADTPAPQRDL